MRQSVSLALFCSLQRAPRVGWNPEEQGNIQKQKQEGVHIVHVPRVLQPGEGQGGGITARGIMILTPVQCHPPVLLPALLQHRHVHHLEKGKYRIFESLNNLKLRQ